MKLILPLRKNVAGWWIIRLNPACGPYTTKKEAKDARRGILKFYRANPSYASQLKRRNEMSKKVKVESAAVVALFEALGAAQAQKWSTSRMMAKVMKLKDYVDEDDAKKLKGKEKATLETLLSALDDGTEIVVVESDPAAPPEKGAKPAKAAKGGKGKKAPKEEEPEEEDDEEADEPEEDEEEPEDDEPEEEEEEEPAKKDKAGKKGGKPAKGKKTAKEEKPVKGSKKPSKPEKAVKGGNGKPAKKAKKEAASYDLAERKKMKLKVYKDWKKSKDKSLSNANLDKYVKMCNDEVKRSTVNYWLWAWNKGEGLPAGA